MKDKSRTILETLNKIFYDATTHWRIGLANRLYSSCPLVKVRGEWLFRQHGSDTWSSKWFPEVFGLLDHNYGEKSISNQIPQHSGWPVIPCIGRNFSPIGDRPNDEFHSTSSKHHALNTWPDGVYSYNTKSYYMKNVKLYTQRQLCKITRNHYSTIKFNLCPKYKLENRFMLWDTSRDFWWSPNTQYSMDVSGRTLVCCRRCP